MSTFFGLVGSIAFFLLLSWITLAVISGAFEAVFAVFHPGTLIMITTISLVLAWVFS